MTYTLPITCGKMRGSGMWLQGCPLWAWGGTKNGLPVSGNVWALGNIWALWVCAAVIWGTGTSIAASRHRGSRAGLQSFVVLSCHRPKWHDPRPYISFAHIWSHPIIMKQWALGEWSMQYYQPTSFDYAAVVMEAFNTWYSSSPLSGLRFKMRKQHLVNNNALPGLLAWLQPCSHAFRFQYGGGVRRNAWYTLLCTCI